MKELKTKLYIALKNRNEQSLEELQISIGANTYTKKEIAACLEVMIKSGWVERYGKSYRLKYVFDKPLRDIPKNQDWVYERIQEVQAPVGRPSRFQNQYVDWVPQCDQGMVGSCVGHAGAYMAWLKQLELIEIKPDKADVQKIAYDVAEQVWGQCVMLHDVKHVLAPSAVGVYAESRRIENITYPAGSTIRGAARACKDYGYNYEKDRYTTKNNTCFPEYYPYKGTKEETIAFLAAQAAEHRLDGYSTVLTWDGLKDAIFNYGCCLIAVNVYENMEANGKTGPFPDPSGEVIGSHALCAVGYDEVYVYFLHSWRSGWSKIGGISQKYYNIAAGPSYAPIDSIDIGIAQTLYGTLNITVNVPSTIYIGTDKYTGVAAKSSLEFNREYPVHVVPQTDQYIPKDFTETVKVTKDQPELTKVYTFTPKETNPNCGWVCQLLKRIFEQIFKKRQSEH